MDINQENKPGATTIVVRKSSVVQIILFTFIGLVLGSGIVGLIFLSNSNKEKEDNLIQPQADQGNQSAGNISEAPDIKKILMSIEVSSFSGVVTSKENNAISVGTSFFGENKNFKVLIDKNTKIYKRVTESAVAADGDPNQNVSESQANFSDIKKGDGVIVDSTEIIKEKTEFAAKSIIIFEYPPIPPAPLPPPLQK